MGGIYRNVTLISVSPVHIDLTDYGSTGIYITPKNITRESADIDITVKLKNELNEPQSISVKTEILDLKGNTVSTSEVFKKTTANSDSSVNVTQKIISPVLWNGRKNPYLYTAKVTLSQNGTELDRYSQRFGIRTYNIDPENGFFLTENILIFTAYAIIRTALKTAGQ